MLGISGTELIIILFFGFLIFGPEKLPQMGRTVGRAIRQFREASDTMSKKIKTEVADPFQEAISPYKEKAEELGAPLRDDIAAINRNLQETKEAFTNPIKASFNAGANSTAKPSSSHKGTVSSAGTAHKAKPAAEQTPASTGGPDEPVAKTGQPDPFGSVAAGTDAADAPAADAAQGKPLPETPTSSIAASLYGLDDDKDGE